MFNTFVTWIAGAGLLLLGLINAVPNFLTLMSFPAEISFIVGIFWHAITLVLVVSWLRWNI
jgi:hypothetical protein